MTKEFVHLLQRGRSLDFVEVFNDKILIKQEGCDMNVIDVRGHGPLDAWRAYIQTAPQSSASLPDARCGVLRVSGAE